MKFLSREKISNHRYKTPEGYLVCLDAIIARTGKQEYSKNEIFKDSDDESIISIDRPYKEVFAPETIASFENKPFVNEHPNEDVNIDNYKDYAIGFVRDVRIAEVDREDVLIANLIVTDPEAIAEIEKGTKNELSCGYDCDILGDENNYYQANIRGNHVALCKAGRARIARIIDSIDNISVNISGDKNQMERLIDFCVNELNLEADKKLVKDSIEEKMIEDMAFNKKGEVIPEHQNYYNDWTEKELKKRLVKADEEGEQNILKGLLNTLEADIKTDLRNKKLNKELTIAHYKKYVDMLRRLKLNHYQRDVDDCIRRIYMLGIKDSNNKLANDDYKTLDSIKTTKLIRIYKIAKDFKTSING